MRSAAYALRAAAFFKHAIRAAPRLLAASSALVALLDFGHQRRTDHGRIGNSSEHGHVRGLRNSEADRDRQLRELAARAAPAPASPRAGARASPVTPVREIRYRKPLETLRDLREARVGGSRRGEKNRVEAVRVHDRAIVAGFFRRQIRGEHAIGACGSPRLRRISRGPSAESD